MRRTWLVRRAISPYAQAVKHLALRGKQALGATAMEDEVAMYRAGTLPMDYRPPRDTPWDDTIERWTYAWQFPQQDSFADSANKRMARENAEGMQLLEAWATRLLEAPPASLPGSADARDSKWPLLQLSGEDAPPALPATATIAPDASSAAATASTPSAPSAVDDDILSLADELTGRTAQSPPPPPVVESRATDRKIVLVSAEEYSKHNNGIPVAYLDDRSERAQASKELGMIVTQQLGETYDVEGISNVISALSHRGSLREGRALLDFALSVGFAATPDLYGALMHGHAKQGDFNAVMVLTEEMKERGVTPAVRNWCHLMSALTKAGECSGAVQVADNMRALANIEPDAQVFAEHLKALAHDRSRLSAPFEAVALFDQMENTYGILPTRIHYHLLLASLSHSREPDHIQRMQDVGRKMELIGLPWDGVTALFMLNGAAFRGDAGEVERLCGKMREEGIAFNQFHYLSAIIAHRESISEMRVNYAEMKERGENPLPMWRERLTVCAGVFDIAAQQANARGEAVSEGLIAEVENSFAVVVALALEHLPDDRASADAIVALERDAAAVWTQWYERYGVAKGAAAYHAHIQLLCSMDRLDEAENLFMELTQDRDTPAQRRTYEALVRGHLASGEEGSTSRALKFLDAMEASGHTIRKAAILDMVRTSEKAAYKRDMKRRARRIIQAREEYLARKESAAAASADLASRGAATASTGVGASLANYGGLQAPEDRSWTTTATAADPLRDSVRGPLAPTVPEASTLAWWDRWKKTSVSKHELFDSEREDGLPRGESMEEKNAALAAMGISSSIQSIDDVPGRRSNTLINAFRREGTEPTAALWGFDGRDGTYPTARVGAESWAGTFWRERQIVKKELDAVRLGHATLPPLSTAGNSVRTVAEQLAIEKTKASTAAELRDAHDMPHHVFDDGSVKPASEYAPPVPVGGDTVWMAERRDPLAPYKPDVEDAHLADESEFSRASARQRQADVQGMVSAIRDHREHEMVPDEAESGVASALNRRGMRKKHEHLERLRDLYRQGSLEAPDEPLLRFGRSEEDAKAAMAAQVRSWFAAQRMAPVGEVEAEIAGATAQAFEDQRAARRAARHQAQRRGARSSISAASRREDSSADGPAAADGERPRGF